MVDWVRNFSDNLFLIREKASMVAVTMITDSDNDISTKVKPAPPSQILDKYMPKRKQHTYCAVKALAK